MSFRLTVSIGWASFPADAEIDTPEMLVYLADQALLMAKETGRNRVVAFGHLKDDVRDRFVRQYHQPCPDTERPAEETEVTMSST